MPLFWELLPAKGVALVPLDRYDEGTIEVFLAKKFCQARILPAIKTKPNLREQKLKVYLLTPVPFFIAFLLVSISIST